MNKNNNTIFIVIIIILAVLLFGGFGYGMMGFNGWNMGSMMYGFNYGIGWLVMILIVVALVLFILWLVKQLQGGKR